MADLNHDERISSPDLPPYIVVYGSDFPDDLIRGARDYAAKHHLKLVCLNSLDDHFDWCDINIDQDSMTPFEWCGYFRAAQAVMTCTYHGLLFGMIFHKPIAFYPKQFILDKAASLITDLGLEEVLIKRTDFAEKVDWMWNYSEIESRLDMMRRRSTAFVISALGHNNE